MALIRPKLRFNKYMLAKTQRLRTLAILFAIVFLGAQFHSCADPNSTPFTSHICPICSTVGSVVATQSPGIAIVPVLNRLEVDPLVVFDLSAAPRATCPRAPPAL
jgi:hypothetical protein